MSQVPFKKSITQVLDRDFLTVPNISLTPKRKDPVYFNEMYQFTLPANKTAWRIRLFIFRTRVISKSMYKKINRLFWVGISHDVKSAKLLWRNVDDDGPLTSTEVCCPIWCSGSKFLTSIHWNKIECYNRSFSQRISRDLRHFSFWLKVWGFYWWIWFWF